MPDRVGEKLQFTHIYLLSITLSESRRTEYVVRYKQIICHVEGSHYLILDAMLKAVNSLHIHCDAWKYD